MHKLKAPLLPAFALCLLSNFLSGCSTTPPQTYDLNSVEGRISAGRGQKNQIIIYEPNVIALYDSERIVVKGKNQGFTYLPQSQWADKLPKLVQTRMIQSFENASRYKSAGRPGDHISAGAVLTTDIRAFEINEETREAIVEISAKLVRQDSGKIETTRIFTARAPVTAIDGTGSSAALNNALQNTLSQIVNWAG